MTGKAFAAGGDEASFARGRGKTPLRASGARTAPKAGTECGARDKKAQAPLLLSAVLGEATDTSAKCPDATARGGGKNARGAEQSDVSEADDPSLKYFQPGVSLEVRKSMTPGASS